MLPTNHLDLGHDGPTSSDTAHARRRAAATGRQPREDQAAQEGGEAEPEERGHGLRFLAPFRVVVGASGDLVGRDVALWLTVSGHAD